MSETPAKRKRKSVLSEHYDLGDSTVMCKTCEKNFSTKTSHSTLKKHYQNHEGTGNLDRTPQSTRMQKNTEQLHRLVLNFVVHGNHPFSIVEEEHFRILLKALSPTYSVLSRTQLNANIQRVFEEKQNEMKQCLKNISSKIALTLDFWTSITNKPYIVVTAHFMLDSKLTAIILEFDLLPYPHKKEQILTKLIEIIEMYGLRKKIQSITSDNEATNVKFMQLLTLFHEEYEDLVHTRCLAHILNLVVKRGLKKIEHPIAKISKLVKVINFAPKKKQMYFEACTLLNAPQLSLIQEMVIRWNTTYLMLERAQSMKTVLD